VRPHDSGRGHAGQADAGQAGAVQRLVDLGFSQYEARAYIGLLGREPMTGYAISNATGVPQPKVYEALRRLAAKGVVAPVTGEPARFLAVPADRLLADLESSFSQRLASAERELAEVSGEADGNGYRVLRSSSAWSEIQQRAVSVIDGARRHVYVSVNCAQPEQIADAIGRADERGVYCDVLHFGEPIVELSRGRAVGHESTRGVLYRRHQARHVAVVADSADVVWALASDGTRWESMAGSDNLLAALAKGYIRHDIYVQQIWNEFHDVLQDRFGPGMQQLVGELSARRPAGAEPAERPAARPERRTARSQGGRLA
jgi:HTH-type transcriptional regulator, sugar sensing transcriptional regulator